MFHGALWLAGLHAPDDACVLQALPHAAPWQPGDSTALAMGVAVQLGAVQSVLAVVAVVGDMELGGL